MLHNCIQGWSAVAQWGGVPLAAVVEAVKPKSNVGHIVFYAFDDKSITEDEGRSCYFYGTIPLHLALKPQTILALEMNRKPLPVEHGAPVRLRIETQLGFKMVKWVPSSITKESFLEVIVPSRRIPFVSAVVGWGVRGEGVDNSGFCGQVGSGTAATSEGDGHGGEAAVDGALEDYASIGQGREDQQYYANAAGI